MKEKPTNDPVPERKMFLSGFSGNSATGRDNWKAAAECKLESFVLSVSALNRYIDCPVSFYYEYVLRAPKETTAAMAFGTSVHYALELFFRNMQNSPERIFAPVEKLLDWFTHKMKEQARFFNKEEYPAYIVRGAEALTDYYREYLDTFNKIVSVEKMIQRVYIRHVPIKGKLDKIEFDGKTCLIVDYKTGSLVKSLKKALQPPSEDNKMGGHYWRQMVFYKILLENSKAAVEKQWRVAGGYFDYVERAPDTAFVRHEITVSASDEATVIAQITDNYRKIRNLEFDHGCGKADCTWCHYVQEHGLYAPLPNETTSSLPDLWVETKDSI